jgi:hypothetical protein
MVQEVIARAIRQKKGNKSYRLEKKEIKLFLFANYMIIYLEVPKEFTKTPRTSEFSKVRGYKITQKAVAFL